jgi:GNAT superfamily N-acetyltransferase
MTGGPLLRQSRPREIEEWDSTHLRWSDLQHLIAAQDQTRWAETQAEWHLSSHFLVASLEGHIVGFLRFVTQVIGVEDDHAPVSYNNVPLTEAKILAFAVDSAYRRQGIGRALQKAAISLASELGCYQVRSHSSGSNAANHQLKLSMGFGVQPIIRGHDKGGVYFILPLKSALATSPPEPTA